jgi:hypothetical protein
MAYPNTKTGFTIRERGRGAFASLWLAGKQLVSTIGFAYAQGASANIAQVTIQVEDKNGNPISGIYLLSFWLSDAATGVGLTDTTASGTVTNNTTNGTDIADITAKKYKQVLTDATGKYVLLITDTAKTGFYVTVANPTSGLLSVSRQLVTGDYK